MQKRRFSSLQIFVTVLAVMFISAVFSVYAAPPVSRYTPGETLDPTCAPGDAECSVIPMNIGDEIGTGDDNSVLFIDTGGNLAEDSTNFYYSDTTDILNVDEINLPTTSSTEGIIYSNSSRLLHAYGTDNLFMGRLSGNFTLTTATAVRNTALGSLTLDALTTGDDNVGIGYQALTSNTDGNDNTAVGINALVFNSSGDANVAVGRLALQRNITGDFNTAVGTSAFQAQGSGTYNTGVGYQALYGGLNDAVATHNTAIGAAAGASVTTGSRNTFLGAFSDLISATPTLSDSIALGYLAQISASNQFVVGSSTSAITDVYIGEGVTSTSPSDVTINTTGGSGTDIAGADLIFAGGKGTGNALGGDVVFSTADVGLTGTTLQSLTEKMRLTSGGRLGLGTTTPDFEFEMVSESENIEGVISSYGGFKPIWGARAANGTEALPTASVAGDVLVEFSGRGYGTSAFPVSATAAIRAVAEETTFTDDALGTQLRFMTVGLSSTTLSQRMTIMADGNIGINDNSPDDLLNISSTSSNGLAITSVGADADPYIKFELTDGTPSFTMGIDDSDSDSFKISTTALGTNDRFIIDSSGNVNVGGDTTPGSMFSVGSTSQFQVTSAGAIAAATGVVSSGTITFSGLSSGIVINSGGTLSSTSQLAANRGGTAINTASSTGIPVITAGTWSVPTTFVYDTVTNFLGIGDATPDFKLDMETDVASSYVANFFNDGNNDNRWGIQIQAGADSATAGKFIQFNDGDGTDVGSICVAGGVAAVCAPSDERLKENIDATTIGLDDLLAIQVRDYSYLSDDTETIRHGFIAQELYEAYPDAVMKPSYDGDFWKVSYGQLTPLIIKSIQEIDMKVEDISSLSLENENSLANRLIAWFADTANGIQNIFAKRVTVEELCFEDVCLTKQDVLELLDDTNIDSGPGPISDGNDSGGEEVPPPTDGEEIPPTVDEVIPEGEGENIEGDTGGDETEGSSEGETDNTDAEGDNTSEMGDNGGNNPGETGGGDTGDTGGTGGEAI